VRGRDGTVARIFGTGDRESGRTGGFDNRRCIFLIGARGAEHLKIARKNRFRNRVNFVQGDFSQGHFSETDFSLGVFQICYGVTGA
jgi:hypothetical protein